MNRSTKLSARFPNGRDGDKAGENKKSINKILKHFPLLRVNANASNQIPKESRATVRKEAKLQLALVK